MGSLDDIVRGFKKKKKVSKKKKSEEPDNINPYILEVTKKGIKLQEGGNNLFTKAFPRVINIIPELFYAGPSRKRLAYQHISAAAITKTKENLFRGKVEDDAFLEVLSSLNIMWPKEIICSHCTEGRIPLCEECDEGWMTCEECGGAWDQECGECGGEGSWTCDDCDGDGTLVCGNCEGESTFSCDDCEGSGGIDCKDCGGEGCNKCSDGIIPCPECEGGVKKCEECNGDGSIHCEYCDGSGEHYCDYCEYGRWVCQECDEGGYTCHECGGEWEEHQCPGCAGHGKWDGENSTTFIKLKELCESPMNTEEKKSNLISGFSEIISEGVYVPPSWRIERLAKMGKKSKGMSNREFIEAINWKAHYYDAFDFNFKNLNIDSLSFLIVPGPAQDIHIYTIFSSSLKGDEGYPTRLNILPIGGLLHPYGISRPTGGLFKKGKNQYGDYLNLNYLQSPAYAESKVIILRSDWYYLKPPFLNWLDTNPALEKD